MRASLVVRDTPPELWAALAAAWRESALAAVRDHGWYAVALSGGLTPDGFYRRLAREPGLPWHRTHLFLADERLAGPQEAGSNARLVGDALIAGLRRPPAGVHFPSTSPADAGLAAAAYERQLREFFRGVGAAAPALDLALLGLGTDGHTASLFPGAAALAERERLVAGVPAAAARSARVTMTLPFLNASGRVIVLATGADKRAPLSRVLAGDRDLPAARLGSDAGAVEFFVDREACPDEMAASARRGAGPA